MIKIIWSNVKGENGSLTMDGSNYFASIQDAENYVQEKQPFGKPERWLSDFLEGVETRTIIDHPAYEYDRPIYDEQGNEIGTEHVSVPEQYHIEYLHPAEYSYHIKDITAELEAARLKSEADALASKQAEIDKFNNQVKSLIKENEDLKAEIIRLEEAKIPRIEKLRNQRNALLASTDHTQLADFYNVLVAKGVDASKEITAYRAYRQYLRDVPNKYPSLEIIPSFSQWKFENNI